MRTALAAFLLCIATAASQAAEFRVFKPGDDGSAGTLRWAILQANANPGPDRIVIDPEGRKPFVIRPDALLPPLLGPLTIEGDRKWKRGRGPDVVLDGSNFIDASTILSCPGENPNQFGPNIRTVQKPGLAIVDTSEVEISGIEVRNFCIGILVWRSHSNFIHDNRLFNNIGGAGLLFTGDNGSGSATVGLTVNNVASHNEFVDNGDGAELTRGSSQNLISDNTFTMTPQGLTPSQGIETINSDENRILRNSFSNFSDGIQMNGGFRNVIAGNVFTGNTNGITLSGTGHVVEGNVITGNRLGIGPTAGNHRLTRNAIFANGQDIILCNAGGTQGTPPVCNPAYPQLGIDLGRNGVTPNDPAAACADGFPDCDSGANGLQNFPVMAATSVWRSNLFVLRGSLASRPNQAYEIELYASRAPGVDGYGEGEVFLGSVTIMTDAAGNGVFSLALDPAMDPLPKARKQDDDDDDGDRRKDRTEQAYFTATATDVAAGATSEFSQALLLRKAE